MQVIDQEWRSATLAAEIKPDLPKGPLTTRPLALLVNRLSASASEVLAGEGTALEGAGERRPAGPTVGW